MNDTTPALATADPAPIDLSSLDIEFDPEDLTLDEVEELEQLLGGVGLDSMLDGSGPKGPALKAIMFVLVRRQRPEVTMADIGRMKLKAIGLDIAAPGGADPEG